IAAGCAVFVPHAEPGLPMLATAAAATAGALTVTAIVGGIRLRAVAGGFVAPLTLVRVLLALGACVAAGALLAGGGKPVAVIEAAAVAAVGLLVLIVTGEVGHDDLVRIRAVAGRRRG